MPRATNTHLVILQVAIRKASRPLLVVGMPMIMSIVIIEYSSLGTMTGLSNLYSRCLSI